MKRIITAKVFFIAFSILILVVASSIRILGYDIVTPALCTYCHEMERELSQWQVTTHSNFKCTKCHKITLGYFTFKHLTGDKDYLEKVKVNIPVETCRRCHSLNRMVSPPGGLSIPHTNHYQRINCIECHDKVGHTNETTRVPKKKCIACHDGIKAPSECITCHKKAKVPTLTMN